jgi:hypothetical protein
LKEYIIMLKSGDSITGIMKEAEARKLLNWYKSRRMELEEFQYEDGVMVLDSGQVAAICINDFIDPEPAGFTQNKGQEPQKED